MISLLRKDVGWYLQNEIISKESAQSIVGNFDQAVKNLVPHVNDCLEAFNLVMVPGMHSTIAKQDYWKKAGGMDLKPEEIKLYDFTKPAERPRLWDKFA